MSYSIKARLSVLLLLTVFAVSLSYTVMAEGQTEAYDSSVIAGENSQEGALPLPRTERNKAGINEGLITSDDDTVIRVMRGEVINPAKGKPYVPDLGLGYILEIVTDKNKTQPAIDFVKMANANGLVPVIRLCFQDPNTCKFKSAADIYLFYETVAQGLAGTDDVFVAALGPNEPGSGEAEAFGVAHGDYATLVNWANTAAAYLQPYRVKNGGNLYLGPAIFNGTNSVPGSDDVKGYLYSKPSINADDFDFILTNLYNDGGKTAKYFYKEKGRSMRKYIKEHPHLKTIITENGFKPFYGKKADTELFKTGYAKLCKDKTIVGILFFRPFSASKLPPGYPAFGPRQNPAIRPKKLLKMIQPCTTKASF